MLLLQIDWNQAQVLAAIVAAITSMIVAIWNFFSTKLNQKEIERIKMELAEKKSENDARRAYEFEAKKRLYQEYEPLLFQLMEASENALHRIQSLARTAKHGNLNENGWLSVFNYYTKSTLYKLFVPIALYQIMQKKLTLVDVSVDKSIGLHYKLAKQLYLSYTDDFEFARLSPNIDYNPNHVNWKDLRVEDQITFWRQGLPMGLLDICTEFLIKKGENGKDSVVSYGEFEKKINSIQNEMSDINLARDIFLNFHPQFRPILWRILVSQSLIFNALLELKKIDLAKTTDEVVKNLLLNISDEFIEKFYWQKDLPKDTFTTPFLVAQEYLRKRF